MATLPGNMRPLNPLRDLMAVADLIELCFHGNIDAEGRSFLDDLRRSSRGSGFAGWAARTSDIASMPMSGFVWEDGGRIVGNVSLIPFYRQGKRINLVANVAVHPDYRRRGIARQLTRRAMQAAQERSSHETWLHVRDDNPGAISLYEELGWKEEARRTAWRAQPNQPVEPAQGNPQLYDGGMQYWAQLSEWFERAYPQSIRWYYSSYWEAFRPGLWHSFQRFIGDVSLREWSAYSAGRLSGALVAQFHPGRSTHLWAAIPPAGGEPALQALLVQARTAIGVRNNLVLEFPADEANDEIQRAGYTPLRTLIWMKAGQAAA